MINVNRAGWYPCGMRCPDCAPGVVCPTCEGAGWHPDSHALNEGLFVDGVCVAKVEAFADEGPFYGNAITPKLEPQRSGPMRSQGGAMDWCENVAGLKPSPAFQEHSR